MTDTTTEKYDDDMTTTFTDVFGDQLTTGAALMKGGRPIVVIKVDDMPYALDLRTARLLAAQLLWDAETAEDFRPTKDELLDATAADLSVRLEAEENR